MLTSGIIAYTVCAFFTSTFLTSGEVKFDGITVGVGELTIGPFKYAADLGNHETFDTRDGGKDGMIYAFDEDLTLR